MKNKKLIISIIFNLVLLGLCLFNWRLILMFYNFDFAPPVDCQILASSYNAHAQQLLTKNVNMQNDKYLTRMSNITGEIFELCQLDFTNDNEFKTYPSQSPLQNFYKNKE